MIEETQHARLSPSASKRWMTCPGSVALTESLNVVDTPRKYAAEGTVAHEVGETCLQTKAEPSLFRGHRKEADGFKFVVNQDMIDAVKVYVDYVREEAEGCILKIETRCSLKSLNIPGLDGGTSDALIIDSNRQIIKVIDYKHGAGVAVEVEGNTQAMSYGLGALMALGAEGEDYPEWVIKLVIVQPRAFHPDGPIREWDISADDLFEWCDDELVPAAKATLEPNAKLSASEDGCRWCAASGQCPELHKLTSELAILDFEDTSPTPAAITNEQKLFVMKHAKVIKSFLTAVEEQVKTEIQSGSTDYDSDYKLVRKQTRRKFTEDAFDELGVLEEYLTEDLMFEKKPLGLTKIETALKKAHGPKAAKGIMDDITTKPTGELVIAPLSDKRKAEVPEAVSDFKDL